MVSSHSRRGLIPKKCLSADLGILGKSCLRKAVRANFLESSAGKTGLSLNAYDSKTGLDLTLRFPGRFQAFFFVANMRKVLYVSGSRTWVLM